MTCLLAFPVKDCLRKNLSQIADLDVAGDLALLHAADEEKAERDGAPKFRFNLSNRVKAIGGLIERLRRKTTTSSDTRPKVSFWQKWRTEDEHEEELRRIHEQELAEEEEREAKRRQDELKQKEEEAVLRARHQARRPLNAFEERRVKRQVRSELTGGGGNALEQQQEQQQDWFRPLRPEVKGQLDDAIKFFSDTMRVPATLIGSAALGMLFLPPFKWAFYKEEQQEPRFIAVWRLYVLLTAFTLCAELTVVLGTSNAHAQLLELGRSGLALEPTAMDLIMSHLEFEYLTCSLSFFGGVVAFMLATFCRVIAVFRFTASRRMPQEPELCLTLGLMILSSLLWWLHLANVRLVEFKNLGTMISRYVQLLVARLRLGEVGLVGCGALLCSALSVLSTVRLVQAPWRSPPRKEE